jgi:glucose/arabinose dehydrogenase
MIRPLLLAAPTALAAAPDESIYVVEDKNGTLIRIARSKP